MVRGLQHMLKIPKVLGRGLQCFYGCPAASTATIVDASSTSSGSSLDAYTDACHAIYALHATIFGKQRYACSSASTSGSLGPRGFQGCAQCTTEAEQNHESGKEGREFVAGVSNSRADRKEKRRQGEYQQPFGCCACARQSQGGVGRSGEQPHAVMGSVAHVPAAVCHQVEGIHLPITSLGSCISEAHAGCHLDLAKGTETCRFGKEESGCYRRRRCTLCHRRRDGRVRSSRGAGSAQGRERYEDPGGSGPGGHKLDRALGIGRQIGTQKQASAHKGRRGWLFYFTILAAFCEGRCEVTELYTHQRPFQVFEPFAVDLHWRHSILEEPSFLAPWGAIDQATDLAAELVSPARLL